jgi:hypothetical protein
MYGCRQLPDIIRETDASGYRFFIVFEGLRTSLSISLQIFSGFCRALEALLRTGERWALWLGFSLVQKLAEGRKFPSALVAGCR